MPRKRSGQIKPNRGRFTALVTDPADGRRKSIGTFDTPELAQAAIDRAHDEVDAGTFTDPVAERTRLKSYATAWLRDRELSGNTRALYESLLRRHIFPKLGARLVGSQIQPAVVREWHAELRRKTGPTSLVPQKSYRLLHAIMATAVEDGLLTANPCKVRGASVERSPERPTVSPAGVFRLADAVADYRRALVLVAGFCGLRLGELIELRRGDVDVAHRVIRVRQAYSRADKKGKRPKNETGRTVDIPELIVDAMKWHLDNVTGNARDAYVFVGPKGGQLTASNWYREWQRALTATGITIHFHDLRHTGNTLFAQTPGTTTKDVMERIGHTSRRAADIYLHSNEDRRRMLTDAMNERIAAELAAAADNVIQLPKR